MSMGHGEHDAWYFKNPAVYRFLRSVVNCDRLLKPVTEALAAQPGESVIDVGCGVGEYSRLVPGPYEGYDLNAPFVEYARRKFANGNKQFFCQDALELDPRAKRYDKGILVNILHHFDDDELNRVLGRLRPLVKQYFAIVDADWDASNRLQRWLLKKDQGSHLRSREHLLGLLGRHFDIQDFSLYVSRSGSVCLFRCRGIPKP